MTQPKEPAAANDNMVHLGKVTSVAGAAWCRGDAPVIGSQVAVMVAILR